MQKFLLACAVLLLSSLGATAAELKVAAVFSDHMVLQRDKAVPVWGWAEPGASVTVEFAPSTGSGQAGQKKTATADANGKWLVKLDPLEASAEPCSLRVSAINHPPLTISDVLVGEVWLGSGQSNMAMTVNRAKDFEKEKAASALPLVRMFKEESKAAATAQADGSGKWAVCTPESVGGFSATLFFFGRELHRELKVPVGLINSSVGGTPIESWIAPEAQMQTPELKEFFASQTKAKESVDEATLKAGYEKQVARWKVLAGKAKKEGKAAPRRPKDPVETQKRKGNVGGLFNGKIAPLIPYALRGAIWYQGEANSHPGKGPFYQYQLPLLVSDWRARWGEEFPFAWVQLPNFGRSGEGWSLVREAMLKSLRLPKTGMAITIDIGEVGNIHPQNKQEVGRRLSLWARSTVYGQKVPALSGPLPAGHDIRGNEIIVAFKHTEGGLIAKDGELKGFAVAGEDKQWKPAQAKIAGDKVIVTCAEVAKPVAVRYAWAADPVCNLYNGAGLPASPFRTDDWPVNEAEKK